MRQRAVSQPRAFTLIEILLALGVLVMMVALVGPALFEQIAPRTFGYTTDRLVQEIRLAREDARRTGEITLVYATPDPETQRIRIESRRHTPEDGSTEAGVFGGEQGSFAASGTASLNQRSFDAQRSGGMPGAAGFTDSGDVIRLLFELPDGYRITFEPPVSLSADPGFGATITPDALSEIGGLAPSPGEPGTGLDPFGADGIGGIDSAGTPELVAVCVPDGSVLPAGSVYLVDPEDRVAQLIIESASGVIRCDAVRAQQDEADLLAQPDPTRTLGAKPGENARPRGSSREAMP